MRWISIIALAAAVAVTPMASTTAWAATFTVSKVTDTDDGTCDADCSLREAIDAANANAGPDVIEFSIPGAGVQTLVVQLGPLPTISEPVLVDGLSQSDAGCETWPPTLRIELDGSALGGFEDGLRFVDGSDGSEVRGLAITDFTNFGLNLRSDTSNISVFCNYLGVDPDGITGAGNGLGIFADGSSHQIGGSAAGQRNLMSSNISTGITNFGSNVVIEGNYIGVDATGNAALANNRGILLSDSGSRIGGTTAGAGNLISGNTSHGLVVDGADTTIVGNIIGSNFNGTSALLGNGGWGILVTNAAGTVQIGGSAAGARNLVTGNGNGALSATNGMDGPASEATTIEGNFFGTNLAGTATLGGGLIVIEGEGHVIGGDDPMAGNVTHEIRLEGSFNRVLGNYICWAVDGVTPLDGCDQGVTVLEADNEIGGSTGNLIRGVTTAITGTDAGAGTSISNNVIGLDITGAPAPVGPVSGIYTERLDFLILQEPSLIVDNVISNCGVGISINDSPANIYGNRIGTDLAGLAAIPNQQGIVYTHSVINIGSGTPGEGNLISGNAGPGIVGQNYLDGMAGATAVSIEGNLIGTDATGLVALPNSDGIVLREPGAVRIGGATLAEGNVISGNLGAGISITDDCVAPTADPSRDHTVVNNLIGVASDGLTPLGNGGIGIALEACPPAGELRDSFIGLPGQGNVISSNLIGIRTRNITFFRIVGNFIGTDRSATAMLGNLGDGVRLDASSGLFVGQALGTGERNVIAFNGGQGVIVTGEPFTGSAIWGNSIYDNVGLGIDLLEPSTGDGVVTPNDPGDPDNTGSGDGPHDLQNYPVLESAVSQGGTTQVTGTLDSLPNADYLVEIFANAACDPSGHGEAETSLGQLQLTTDAQGIAVIDATFPVGLAAGQSVTATAIDSINQTSEISMCLAIQAGPVLEVPALGPWGLALLAAFLCLLGVSTSRRLGS